MSTPRCEVCGWPVGTAGTPLDKLNAVCWGMWGRPNCVVDCYKRALAAATARAVEAERALAGERERAERAEAGSAALQPLLARAAGCLTAANEIIANELPEVIDDGDFDDASELIGECERALASPDPGAPLVARLRAADALADALDVLDDLRAHAAHDTTRRGQVEEAEQIVTETLAAYRAAGSTASKGDK